MAMTWLLHPGFRLECQKYSKSVSKCAKIRWLLRNLCCSRPGLPRKHLKNSKSSKFLRFKMPCTLKTCWFVTWFHYYYYYLIMRKSNSLARRCQLQFGWAMRAWCVMSQWGATWKKKVGFCVSRVLCLNQQKQRKKTLANYCVISGPRVHPITTFAGHWLSSASKVGSN